MAEKRPKRPRDFNQFAKHMVDLATGNAEEPKAPDRDEAAQEFGRQGGKARAERIPPDRRSEIAREAARKRWAKR